MASAGFPASSRWSGPGKPRVAPSLYGLYHLVCLDASCAHLHPLNAPLVQDLYRLDIGKPPALCFVVCMTHTEPDAGSLTTDITPSGHAHIPPTSNEYSSGVHIEFISTNPFQAKMPACFDTVRFYMLSFFFVYCKQPGRIP